MGSRNRRSMWILTNFWGITNVLCFTLDQGLSMLLTTIPVSVYSCECLPLRYNTRRWRILGRWCVHHGPHRRKHSCRECVQGLRLLCMYYYACYVHHGPHRRQHSCRECVPRLWFLCMCYVYNMYTMVHTDASIPVGSVSRVYDFYVCIMCYIICTPWSTPTPAFL